MFGNGELDAALIYLSGRNVVDRTAQEASEVGGLHRLFPDPIAEGVRYYAKTGILPANHTVVIRASLLEKHPWAALNIFSAFVAAKRAAFDPLTTIEGEIGTGGGPLEPWLATGAISVGTMTTLAQVDPVPYGLAAQHRALDALAAYLLEQGLVHSPVDMTGLFAPSTQLL